MSSKVYDLTCNMSLARRRNDIDNVRVNSAFPIEMIIILMAIYSHFKGS